MDKAQESNSFRIQRTTIRDLLKSLQPHPKASSLLSRGLHPNIPCFMCLHLQSFRNSSSHDACQANKDPSLSKQPHTTHLPTGSPTSSQHPNSSGFLPSLQLYPLFRNRESAIQPRSSPHIPTVAACSQPFREIFPNVRITSLFRVQRFLPS